MDDGPQSGRVCSPCRESTQSVRYERLHLYDLYVPALGLCGLSVVRNKNRTWIVVKNTTHQTLSPKVPMFNENLVHTTEPPQTGNGRAWSRAFFTAKIFQRALFLGLLLCVFVMYKLWGLNIVSKFNSAAAASRASPDTINVDARKISRVMGLSDLPNVSYTIHYKDPITGEGAPSMCASNGYFVGTENNPSVDCNSICGGHADEFAYRYFDADSYLTKYLFSGKPGGYCVPSKIGSCNPYTSTIVRGVYDWTCLAKWPSVFGGPQGTDIRACGNSRITDLLTDTNHVKTIPQNLLVRDPWLETVDASLSSMPHVSQSVYDKYILMNDLHKQDSVGRRARQQEALTFKHPRFVCTDEIVATDTGSPSLGARKSLQYDSDNNRLIAAPEISRFARIRNTCSKYLQSANYRIAPDFNTGECVCVGGAHGLIDEPEWGTTTMPRMIADKTTDHAIMPPPQSTDYLSKNYSTIFENGWLEPSLTESNQEMDEKLYRQSGAACSPCAMGFVKLDNRRNAQNNIDRIVRVPYTKSQLKSADKDGGLYTERVINLPLPCVAPSTVIDNNTFGGSFTNVRLCTGNIRCVNMLIDASLGPSYTARKIINTNKFASL